MTFADDVGLKLRNIRKQKGLSLKDVEKKSKGKYKASTLGAYERNERNVSITHLHELATFYDAPVDYFLTQKERTTAYPGQKVTFDLKKLKEINSIEKKMLLSYFNYIRNQRGDYGNGVISVRADDLTYIAALLRTNPETMVTRLEKLGVMQ